MPLLTPPAPFPLMSNLVAAADPFLINNLVALTANEAYGLRVTIPYTGVLHGLSVYVGGSAGNVDFGIYDCTVTTRNKLYSSGSIACGSASAWQTVDPNLAVNRGDQVDFAFACSTATTATFGRIQQAATGQNALPTGFRPAALGASARLEWGLLTSFPLPATISEASFATTSSAPLLIAYLTPTAA